MLDRRLLYVVATAQHGSFTAAAEKVGVTQSAITKSIGDLERQLGYLLFNRTARGVIATEEGRTFVDRAVRVLAEAQELLRGSLVGADPYAGLLKIGVCPASIEWLLLEPITTLSSRHPSIRLDITGASFERTVQQLRAGAIDVALGFEAAFREQSDFHCEALPGQRTTFFVRHGHPLLASGGEVSKADLARYEMISPSDSRPYDSFIRKIYEEVGIEAQTRIHFIDFFPLIARLVAKSDAIASVSEAYTATPAFQKRFARVPFPSGPLAPLCIATRARWSPRPAVRAFIKACREHLVDEQPAN